MGAGNGEGGEKEGQMLLTFSDHLTIPLLLRPLSSTARFSRLPFPMQPTHQARDEEMTQKMGLEIFEADIGREGEMLATTTSSSGPKGNKSRTRTKYASSSFSFPFAPFPSQPQRQVSQTIETASQGMGGSNPNYAEWARAVVSLRPSLSPFSQSPFPGP